jgi:hypothetical protein
MMETAPKEFLCLKCGAPQNAEMVARLAERSEMTFTLKPMPGEFMSAKSVGGSMEGVAELLRLSGKAVNVPTEVLVKSILTDEDGTIRITMLICRHEAAKEIKARRKEARATLAKKD